MSLSIKISIIIIILSLFPDIGSSPVFAFKNGFLLKNQQRQMQRQMQRQQQMRRQQQMQRQRQQQAQRQRTIRNRQLQQQRQRQVKRQQLQRNKRLQAQRKLQRQRQLRQQRARTQKQRHTRNLQKYALLRNPLTTNRIASRGINKRVRWKTNKFARSGVTAQKNRLYKERIRQRQEKNRRHRESQKRKKNRTFILAMGKKSLVALGGHKSYFRGASGAKLISSIREGKNRLNKRLTLLKKAYKKGKNTETVQRWMSKSELKETKKTGLLRGGKGGTHYVTDSANSNALRARQRSSLPQTPEVKVTLEVPKGVLSKPSKVRPAFNMPGGGTERTATGKIPVTIKKVE